MAHFVEIKLKPQIYRYISNENIFSVKFYGNIFVWKPHRDPFLLMYYYDLDIAENFFTNSMKTSVITQVCKKKIEGLFGIL